MVLEGGVIEVNGFFFSSRRRHTRFDCDWSSDVCSSDLSERNLLFQPAQGVVGGGEAATLGEQRDRKSTRLNSSHSQISYAVFCLKKKNNSRQHIHREDRRHRRRSLPQRDRRSTRGLIAA